MNAEGLPARAGPLSFIREYKPLKVQFGSEIHQQANLDRGRPQMVQQLGAMAAHQAAAGLDLDQQPAFHEKVCTVLSD